MTPSRRTVQRRHRLLALAVLALATAACSRDAGPANGGAAAPAAPAGTVNLGAYRYKVTTASPEAQRAFDRGITLAFGFGHEAAEREFRKAAELDPKCAMAWWGVALVNGPHINFPLVPPDHAKTAWDALKKARELAAGASETERGLIEALGKRYAESQPEDRKPLDAAYAAAMRDVHRAHPEDAAVATLFAEAMMDLRPWDLWTLDGKPQPGTDEILATLEDALRIAPDHPGANHLYIHAVEASPHPEKGLASAERLGGLVPGLSHLVHMPSHIYARVGRWEAAAGSNGRAIAADADYRKEHPRPGFYAMYMAHNQHFLAYAQAMRGRSADAIRSAREMEADVPREFLEQYAPIADGYVAFVPEMLMRFGRWEEVLKEPEPRDLFPLARALWRFTRAASLTALSRTDEAEREREEFRKAAAAVPKDRTFGNNPAADILAIASNLLDGEMAAKRDRLDEAAGFLRAAIEVEDRLRYDEPPDWMQPVRHTLGAVLMRAGRRAEAEQVYRDDLARYPENGWSLFGLSRALRLQGKDGEADAIEARFQKIWAGADVTLESTCYCQPGA